MSDILISQELTKALSEVASKIREGRVAAEAGQISEQSKKVMQDSYRNLKDLSQKIAAKLPLSARRLHLTMGKYAPNGKYKSHLWSAIIPITVRAPSHITPQLYIFRSNNIFAWGISPSDAAIGHPEFMDAYRGAFRANQSEARKLFSEGFVGREYAGDSEIKTVEQFLSSKNMTLARVYAIRALPSQEKLFTQIESDLIRLFDLYSKIVAACTKGDLLDRLNSDSEDESTGDDQWLAAWNEWFECANDVAENEVPEYLQREYGKSWKSIRQVWEVGRAEALRAFEQAAKNEPIPEERIQALLFGSLRRTAMTGGWRTAVKENFSSILKEVHSFSRAHAGGCTNAEFQTLLDKVQKIGNSEARSFVTRLLCDLQPNHYLPLAKLTIPALKKAAGVLGATPALLKSTDDYEAVCREAKRLAEKHPNLPSDAMLYVFDHFLYWLENEYTQSEWKAAKPKVTEQTETDPAQGFWKISCGRGGRYSSAHRKTGYISIGWGGESGIPDLSPFTSQDALAAAFKNVLNIDYDPGYAASQCWTFVHNIRVGDYIFGYGSGTVLLVGRVSGAYQSKVVTDWAGPGSVVGPTHRHIRSVQWLDANPVETTSLPVSLKNRLEHNQTTIKLTKEEADQILKLAGVSEELSQRTPEIEEVESLSLEALCKMTAKPKEFFTTMERRLLEKRQIVLYGPPGTSKTHIATQFSKYFQSGNGLIESVQFHPSYSYEDFIEGYRPNGNGGGAQFVLNPGVFKEFCKRALASQDDKKRHVFIIDEINRGNLPQIFGELLYLLEYRGDETTLPYSKSPFQIPENVYIIATMNSADRSIAMVDYALRRRFEFFDLSPDAKTLKSYLEQHDCQVAVDRVVSVFEKLNAVVAQELGKHYRVGHTYFMKPNLTEQALKEIWQFSVVPLLEEYFFDNERAAEALAFDSLWGKESEAA